MSHPRLPPLFCGALVLSLALVGCAIKTTHLNISQWPVAKRAMYYQDPLPYRLAVLPLMDERPVEERTGKRPGGMFLLVWNKRVGDYVTGDHVFGQEVPRRLTDQLAEYLRQTHVFAEIVPFALPSQPSDRASAERIQQLAREQVVDYVLGGAVEHFYGSQHQQTSMLILPLYFINMSSWQDSKSLPWGKTTMRFVLYDGRTGDIMWRHRLEADETLPRETDAMSEAALESFATLAGNLVMELRQLPLAPVSATPQE